MEIYGATSTPVSLRVIRRAVSVFSPITHFTDKHLFIAIKSNTTVTWLRVKKKYLWRIERATPKCVAFSGHGPWDNHSMRESENDSVVDVNTHNEHFFCCFDIVFGLS